MNITYRIDQQRGEEKCQERQRQYIEDLAQQIEASARHNNMEDLYLTAKKLTGKFKQTQSHIKDKE